MPGKIKELKGPPADDFDDIIAQATQLNASIVTTSSGSSSSNNSISRRNANNASTSSSSRSSCSTGSGSGISGRRSRSNHALPTEEEVEKVLTQMCIAGDLVRLRRYLGPRDRRISARPLLYAAAYGKLDILRCLVEEYGADGNEGDDDGDTPLYYAAHEGQLKVVQCLVKELGADVNQASNDGRTPLFIAALEGRLKVVQCLVKELCANVNQASNDGCTPLFIAAQEGQLKVVQCLVKELGADINQAAPDGTTPLMVASRQKHEKIVRYLLKNGANAQASLISLSTAADVSKWYGAPAAQTAYIESRTHCANSGCSGAGLKKCASCLEVFFCSKECQVAAWPAHKADCKRRVKAKTTKKT
jgi:hypothetical protein